MRKITDLTLPVVEHWRYGIKFELATSHAIKDRWQTTKYNLQSHWFTHIDAPVHHDPDGKNLDAYPISDWCISYCLIPVSYTHLMKMFAGHGKSGIPADAVYGDAVGLFSIYDLFHNRSPVYLSLIHI